VLGMSAAADDTCISKAISCTDAKGRVLAGVREVVGVLPIALCLGLRESAILAAGPS